jgi:type II secretory pathway component PulK
VKNGFGRSGSVLLVVVLLVALLAATVTGHLHVNAEEIQLMRNHVHGAEALATAEAGLNEALAALRQNARWDGGRVDKSFNGGNYSVSVEGWTVRSVGTTSAGYMAAVEADVRVSPDGPPHVVTIESLRINE